MKTSKRNTKVLVIGLDGTSWDLIAPWIDAGELPALKKLMDGGSFGELESTIPPLTGPAWVSFATGKNPGKHGILDFTTPDGKIINSRLIRDETLWDILSEEDLLSCLVNVPVTYPPKEINGCIIACFLTPPGKKDFVYPPSFMEIVEKNDYRIDIEFEKYGFIPGKAIKENEKFLDEVYDIAEKRYKTVLDLIKKDDWDFFMLVFKETDVIQHLFWGDEEVLLNFFKKIDGYIEDILVQFRSNCCKKEELFTFAISDHGFGESPKKIFNIYGWLKEGGFFDVSRPESKGLKNLVLRSYLILNKGGRLERTFIISKLLRRLLKARGKSVVKTLPFEYKSPGLFIRKGGLDTKEYEKLRSEIIERLKEVKDPETGEKIFKLISKKEDIYSGEHLDSIPDIIIFSNPSFLVSPSVLSEEIWEKSQSEIRGEHSLYRDGILIANGPEIKKGTEIEGAKLYDVVPTILHIFGLPVPRDMDGRVLEELFEAPFLKKSPIKYRDMREKRGKEEGGVLSEEDEKRIKDRLKGLGYM